jgi:hypothetical protein
MSGPRRVLAAHSQALLYTLAALTYVLCGIWAKWLLNWIVGPLWLLGFAWGLPRAWELLRGERSGRRDAAGTP